MLSEQQAPKLFACPVAQKDKWIQGLISFFKKSKDIERKQISWYTTKYMWIDHLASTSIDNTYLNTNQSDISRMSGDGDDLESICSNNGTPANLFSAIVTTGWSVSTIAMGFSDASEFDQEATLRDLGITEDISRLERAALKVVWAQCKQIFNASQAPSTGSAPAVEVPTAASTNLSSTRPEGGWNEAFPPKLSQSVVLEMKKKLKKTIHRKF